MPNVGGKKFPYTPRGMAMASRARRPRPMAVKRPMARPMGRPMGRPMARPLGRPMARPMRRGRG